MTNLSPEFCRKIKAARRLAKLGQVELATEVGCKQSALSAFENGDGTKLNDEVINKLSKKFGIALETLDSAVTKTDSAVVNWTIEQSNNPSNRTIRLQGFCPNPHCPSNHGYEVDGRLFLRPNRDEADPVGGKFCALCGEVLVKRCPNCGSPVHAGAVCSVCGDAYVSL